MLRPLFLLVVPLLACPAAGADVVGKGRPVNGDAVKGYDPVDKAVTDFMDRIDARAATAAVFVDGRMVYARGFGWRDKDRKVPARPDDLMRVASVSKPVTAALVKDLIRAKKLSPDTKVFPYLGLSPPAGAKPDPRLAEVTVQHLLDHKGGWDREQAPDPMFQVREVERALKLRAPAGPADVIRYMLGRPLQFAPGERAAYSNFGYCVLGRVVEKATGGSYAAALQKGIAEPLKIADLKVGRTKAKDRDKREVWYPVPDDMFSLEVMDAHGGIVASAPALGRFAQSYWITGERRKPGEKGWHWIFFGSLPGTTAMLVQRPDGTDVAVLLNARRDASFAADNDTLLKAVTAAIDAARAGGARR